MKREEKNSQQSLFSSKPLNPNDFVLQDTLNSLKKIEDDPYL